MPGYARQIESAAFFHAQMHASRGHAPGFTLLVVGSGLSCGAADDKLGTDSRDPKPKHVTPFFSAPRAAADHRGFGAGFPTSARSGVSRL